MPNGAHCARGQCELQASLKQNCLYAAARIVRAIPAGSIIWIKRVR